MLDAWIRSHDRFAGLRRLDLGSLLLVFDLNDSILVREFAELHDVARQSASLVAEDVLDLAQFLIDIGGLGLHWEIIIRVVHIDIPAHERALPELYDLERYDKRDRNKVCEDEDPGTRLLDE